MPRLLAMLLGCALLPGCGDNIRPGTLGDGGPGDSLATDAVATDAALELQLFDPSPYLRAEDSPFHGLALGSFQLEDFEDGQLDDIPGVTDNGGHNTRSLTGDVDSVDGDDGVLDNRCANCDAWHHTASELSFTWAGPSLPTHVGVVWTDAAIAGLGVTFEAFDGQGVSLGTKSLPNHSDAFNNGTTAEDRFFGVISPSGVSRIRIANSSGGIEIDHLQAGR